MKYSLILQAKHLAELKSLTLKDDKLERPALLLCGVSSIDNDVWDGGSQIKFLSKEVIEVPPGDINTHSEVRVNWDTAAFRKAMKKAKEDNLTICLVHSHPSGSTEFSTIDDLHETELMEIMYRRNGRALPGASLVITQDEQLFARAFSTGLKIHAINRISVFGEKYEFFYPGKYTMFTREEFSRQQLAFGSTLNADLSKLKVAVVGCGATGSATAQLLARLGVGHLLFIDNDLVERSNLSRLHGANSSDADAGRSKAMVMNEVISRIAIGCRTRYIHDWVGSQACRDALKSCDLIFCCTDDHSGRIFLNRYAYFYLTPVVDMGIVIDPSTDGHPPLQTLQGRITVIQTEYTCLLCRGIVNRQLAREEQLKRNDPQGFERQKDEAYVTGSGNPSPAVITFTTEVATMASNELINRLTGFKKGGSDKHLIRFFDQGVDRKPHVPPGEDCPICGDNMYWGLGDVTPFLDIVN